MRMVFHGKRGIQVIYMQVAMGGATTTVWQLLIVTSFCALTSRLRGYEVGPGGPASARFV